MKAKMKVVIGLKTKKKKEVKRILSVAKCGDISPILGRFSVYWSIE